MHDSVNANWHWFSQCKALPDTSVYRVFKATLGGGGAQEWADKSCHSFISIREPPCWFIPAEGMLTRHPQERFV